MKMLWVLLFFSGFAHANIPQDWITGPSMKSSFGEVSSLPEEDAASLNHILRGHESLLEDNEFSISGWKIDRFDIELGINLKGEFGILATDGQAGIEFVWQRKKKRKALNSDQEIVLSTDDPLEIEKELFSRINEFIKLEKLSARQRRKIIKVLRQDALKISFFIRDMASMPRVGDWYVGGFFKIYSFSTKGNLSAFELGKDKRIRFRFSFGGIPVQKKETHELRGTQLFHLQMMKSLNYVSRLEEPNAGLRLRRVRARVEFEKELDLIFFSSSAGYSLQPFYLKVPDEERMQGPLQFLTPEEDENFLLRPFLIGKQFMKKIELPWENKFELSQIRAKFSLRTGGGWGLATLEKNSVLEFHFMTRDP